MERILVMDEKNYSPDLEEIYRVAVRGIIFIDGKLLMTKTSHTPNGTCTMKTLYFS